MSEEFVDSVEYRLRTDLDMMGYWESLQACGIDPVLGRKFLDAVWVATMVDSWPLIERGNGSSGERYFTSLARQIREADELTNQVNELAEKYPESIQSVPMQQRDLEDERVIKAFGSRKTNPGLHLARYLIDDAVRIFGRPCYEAVAIATTVALRGWVDTDVDGKTLCTVRNRR